MTNVIVLLTLAAQWTSPADQQTALAAQLTALRLLCE